MYFQYNYAFAVFLNISTIQVALFLNIYRKGVLSLVKGNIFRFAERARRKIKQAMVKEPVYMQVFGDAREDITEVVLHNLEQAGVITYFLRTAKLSYADIMEQTDFYVAVRTEKRLECFRIDVTGPQQINTKNCQKSKIVIADLNLPRNELEESIKNQILEIIEKL